MENICDIVRKMEADDRIGNTKISKYVTHNQREVFDTVDAYINSNSNVH